MKCAGRSIDEPARSGARADSRVVHRHRLHRHLRYDERHRRDAGVLSHGDILNGDGRIIVIGNGDRRVRDCDRRAARIQQTDIDSAVKFGRRIGDVGDIERLLRLTRRELQRSRLRGAAVFAPRIRHAHCLLPGAGDRDIHRNVVRTGVTFLHDAESRR